MTKEQRRQRKLELVSSLQKLRDGYEIRSILDLLALMVEDAKDSLVNSELAQVPRLQAEAQAYAKIASLITRPSVALNEQKD